MLFGTWSQARAYDPSDYMETRLKLTTLGILSNFPFIIFNDYDYDVVLFQIPTRD